MNWHGCWPCLQSIGQVIQVEARRCGFGWSVGALLGLTAMGCGAAPEGTPPTSAARTEPAAETPAASLPAPAGEQAASEVWRIGAVGTEFYTSSPAQGRPPDGKLEPGTTVNVLERAGSYTLVRWGDQSVWVSSDSLERVPAGTEPGAAEKSD